MINIYELLLEMSHEIGEEMLKKLIIFSNLLAFLYEGWLKNEDTREEELQHAIMGIISSFVKTYEKTDKEEKEKKTA